MLSCLSPLSVDSVKTLVEMAVEIVYKVLSGALTYELLIILIFHIYLLYIYLLTIISNAVSTDRNKI